jgi:hypothetical protein
LRKDQEFKQKVMEEQFRIQKERNRAILMAEKQAKGDRSDTPETKARYRVLVENHLI